jgi:GNAT superfamily N-acetyltransferase
MKIIDAASMEQLETARGLFLEYERYLQVDLCFQKFEEELAALPGDYAVPDGALLLAVAEDAATGCVAMRKIEPGVCEMKRLYVRPPFQRQGIGKQLAITIIDKAREVGYRKMRLDTLNTLDAAMALYASIGFRKINPYYDNPLPGAVYWEVDLLGNQTR